MNVQLIGVSSHQGHSKNSGKDYDFCKAYISEPMTDFSGAKTKGHKGIEVMISRDIYNRIVNLDLPCAVQVVSQADLSRGTVRVTDIVPARATGSLK